MKTTYISTQSISEATRLSMMSLQSKIADAQKEVTTGRLSDVGLSLGHRTGDTISLRHEMSRLTTIIDTNAIASANLDITQSTLSSLSTSAQDFISTLIGSRNSDTGASVAQVDAKGALTAMIDAVNLTMGGAHLFAGINADVTPLQSYYQTPAPANRQAVADAFQATFGFPQSDPAAQSISASDMQNFLDTTFSSLFDDPQWGTTWSSASDQNARSRISTHELIDTSVNANEPGIRKLAKALTMVADLGVENLNQGAFQAIVDSAIKLAGESVQDLALAQSKLGTVQQRISNASDRMSLQIDIMTKHVNGLETVDPAEASTRVSALMTQLETSYALTARVQKLSLLNYL